MKTYRVALLGCRSRGTATGRVYHAHPRTQVVGLCDLIEDRLNTLGDYWFVDEYVRALDEGRAHECSGAEGRHVVEIIMGIFESAAYGKRVDLPQVDRQHPLLRWRGEAGLGDPEPMPMTDAEWLEEEKKRLGD
jgi:predicted dehydrogenase